MDEKEVHTLASFLEDVTEKVKARHIEQQKIETVLIDLTDELKTCMRELTMRIDDKLKAVKDNVGDPDKPSFEGYRMLGEVEGLHQASEMIQSAVNAVLGRIHGPRQ